MTATHRLSMSMSMMVSALALAAAPAHAGERVRWPIAWKAGEVATFDSESVVREIEDGVPQTRRVTDRTEIRTDEAGKQGYALVWSTRDSRVEAVEGDRSTTDLLAPMLDELDGFEIVVELDRDGRYRRVRNLDAVVAKVRKAMLPLFSAGLHNMFAEDDPKLSKIDREAALASARSDLDASVERIVTARGVEAMSSAQAKAITAFVGRPLEVGRRYRDAEPMNSPLGGWPLPASREYALSLVKEDANLARIRWTLTLDPRADAKVLWALVGELTGNAELGARGQGRPADLALREEGVVLFRRDTGAVEMLETVQISRYGDVHDGHDRYRMRRIGNTRSWAQEEAAAKR